MSLFPWCPTLSSRRRTRFRVRTVAMGDGYAQKVPEGLHVQANTWDLEFRKSTRELLEIRTFLEAAEGRHFFWFQDPDTGRFHRVECEEFSNSPQDAPHQGRLSAVFVEVVRWP